MALSFAMCASLAFAQTPGTLSRHIPDGIQRSLNLSEMKNKPVDYKASIFSKDDDADTLHCFNFSTADMTGITYGTNAKITASMTINDTTVGNANAHTPNVANSYWWRYNDSASFASTLANNSPAFADWDSVNGGGAAFIMRYGMGLRYAGDKTSFSLSNRELRLSLQLKAKISGRCHQRLHWLPRQDQGPRQQRHRNPHDPGSLQVRRPLLYRL